MDAVENILERVGLGGGAGSVRGKGSVETEEVSSVTVDVRYRHGGSGLKADSTIVPDEDNISF